MAQSKNVMSVIFQCTAVAAVVTFAFLTFGYSLAFSPAVERNGSNAVVGTYEEFWFHSIKFKSVHQIAPNIPETVFVMYQLSFAILTCVLIVGCFEGRAKFGALISFLIIWHLIVYCPIVHWNWHPDGFLYKLGVLDAAGGNVVHVSSGWAGFIGTIIIGNRKKFDKATLVPHDINMVILGLSMLWVGWFGFNGGASYSAGANAGMAVLVTQLSASMAMLTWISFDRLYFRRFQLTGCLKGILCGLIAITPGSAFVDCNGGVFIGVISGAACFSASLLKVRYNIDDYYDAFGLHVVGGAMGGILVAFFAQENICGTADHCVNGIFYTSSNMGWKLLGYQLFGILVTSLYSLIMTYFIIKLVDKVVVFRVTEEEEKEGLDMKLHGSSHESALCSEDEVPDHHKPFYNLENLELVGKQGSIDAI